MFPIITIYYLITKTFVKFYIYINLLCEIMKGNDEFINHKR